MLRHKLTVGGEDVSGYMISAHIEKYGDKDKSDAKADFVLANLYGMFTGKWRDDGDEKAKIGLILENERVNCIGEADIRQEGSIDISLESNIKQYHAFCGYITKIEYDEKHVTIHANTSEDFLEQEPMPDGVRPIGGTAYIAMPPAEIILDVIKQHKDPPISVGVLTEEEAANKGYPVLKTQRKNLPQYKPSTDKKDTDGGKDEGKGGGGGEEGQKSRSCKVSCRYKKKGKCCSKTSCPYKSVGTLCKLVQCPYDDEKAQYCPSECPYDTDDCPDKMPPQDLNKNLKCALSQVSQASLNLEQAKQAYQNAKTAQEKLKAADQYDKAIKEYNEAQENLKDAKKFQEKAAAASEGDPEDMVSVDFWDPQIIKDQVQGVKGVKYADVIRAVCQATGGIFFVDNQCRARFVPPNYIEATTETDMDITALVTKQNLGKNAMGHANIVVVYGSGITEPGKSPVERERHKVVGYLAENPDSIARHGTIQAAEVDVHYLPKQNQVEELAKNLIEYYKGEDDKAVVSAIGIDPLIFQKVKWEVPIGPQMDTEQCQFGSTAILAVIDGRVNKVTLDYSTEGWKVDIDVATEGWEVS